jgi:hypothetical protein
MTLPYKYPPDIWPELFQEYKSLVQLNEDATMESEMDGANLLEYQKYLKVHEAMKLPLHQNLALAAAKPTISTPLYNPPTSPRR